MFNRKVVGVGAVGALALVFVAHNEGTRYTAYRDQGGVWTICQGHTGPEVHQGLTVDAGQCKIYLQQDLQKAAIAVDTLVEPRLNECQRTALQDFTFNVGVKAFAKSTLLRKLNAGDFPGAANEFPKWDIVAGTHNPGVLKRRVREQALFRKDDRQCSAL